MKLSEIPFKDLKVGMKCVSVVGTHGKIIDLLPEGIDGVRGDTVIVEWENGKISYPFYTWCDKLILSEDIL